MSHRPAEAKCVLPTSRSHWDPPPLSIISPRHPRQQLPQCGCPALPQPSYTLHPTRQDQSWWRAHARGSPRSPRPREGCHEVCVCVCGGVGVVRASLAAGQGWVLGLGRYGCSLGLALHSIQSFGPKSASLSVPSYLTVGLPACMTQLPCQPGSACPAFRFAASCAAGQAVGESARATGASPEPSPWREATQSRERVLL